MKKISVIIPCYNVEYYIDRLFDCLVRQTMPLSDFEIILINDASTDNTLEKLVAWEKEYEDSIIIINFEENMGLGAARNAGLDAANGEYITFIDADDWVELNYLEAMYKTAVRSDCDIVRFEFDRPYIYDRIENEKELQNKVVIHDVSLIKEKKTYISENILASAVWGKLYKSIFIEKNGLCFPCKTYYEDVYFTYLAYIYANKIAVCEDVLYHYYRNINGIILGSGESECFDRIAVMRMLYDTIIANNLLNEYYDEIELIFIKKYFGEIMDVMFRTFSEVDYNMYCAVRDWFVKKFPNYGDNKYLNDEYNNVEKMFLQCIQNDLNEIQLKAFRRMYLIKIYNKDKPDSVCSKKIVKTEFPMEYDMFDLLNKIIIEIKEENEITDDFNDLKLMISCMPVTKDGDILSICNSNPDIWSSEIYRYYVHREIFISSLKDKVRRKQIDDEKQLEIYNQLLDTYNELIV